jgi:dihydroxyacetone kinase-like protein
MQDGIDAWLRSAAVRVRQEAPSLTALDQAIGDGDHGINLDRGFAAIVAMLDERTPPEDGTSDAAAAADVLRQAGKRLISTVGGAAGPLYGTAFLRAAGAIATGPDASPAAEFVAALEAAVAGIAALGKSTEGEKTMLDALYPAARAARAALDGGDLAAVTAAARDAAAAGARATIPMLATKGRASYLGERSVGHQDPGATSAALLLAVLAETAAAGDEPA